MFLKSFSEYGKKRYHLSRYRKFGGVNADNLQGKCIHPGFSTRLPKIFATACGYDQ
jgi:hypothetical protein